MRSNVIELVMQLQDQVSAKLGNITGKLKTFGGALAGIAGVATIGATFQKIVAGTIESERALAKLNFAYEKFGQTVRVRQADIEAFADSASRVSIFDDESLLRAQASLLKFSSVQSLTFKRARQVALDLASVLETDIVSATELVGRALERPSVAIRQLRSAGVIFTADQEKLIRSLESTGKTAEAQAIILAKLEQQFRGGSTQAANTLGGALTKLRNSFDNLFEASPESANKLAKSVNGLNEALNNQTFKNGTRSLLDFFSTGISRAAEFAVKVETLKFSFIDLAKQKLGFGEEQIFRRTGTQARTGRRGGDRDQGGIFGDVAKEETQREAEEIAEVVVTATKRANGAMQTLLDGWRDSALSTYDRELQQFYQRVARLDELQRLGRISGEEYARAYNEALEEVLSPVEITVKKVKVAEDELTAAQRRMAENLQDAFARAFGAIDQGIKGMLRAFLEAFKQILIQAAAVNLAEALKLPGTKSGGSQGGGFAGTVIKTIASIFGFAGGGSFPGNRPFVAGEEGPELIVPTSSGRVFNARQLAFAGAGRGAGTVVINQTNNFTGGGESQEAAFLRTQAQIRESNARLREAIRRDMREGNFGGAR